MRRFWVWTNSTKGTMSSRLHRLSSIFTGLRAIFSQNGSSSRATVEWDRDTAQSALDELFQCALRYTGSKEFRGLVKFIARFRWYSPFNAMLAHIQMPGASYVAPAYRWARDYRRRIRPGARPIVLLQPGGPVMFVFDVSDTEPLPDAKPLPMNVTQPFEVRAGNAGNELGWTMENAKRDGVWINARDAGSQSAGQISRVEPEATIKFQVRKRPKPEFCDIKVRYELLLNTQHSPEAKYATLVHELAHLYCGHLGTPNSDWWPNRYGLQKEVAEFEAESVAFLVCSRIGIENPSTEYLSGYVKDHKNTPPISLGCVLKSAGLIEQMGQRRLGLRKERVKTHRRATPQEQKVLVQYSGWGAV